MKTLPPFPQQTAANDPRASYEGAILTIAEMLGRFCAEAAQATNDNRKPKDRI